MVKFVQNETLAERFLRSGILVLFTWRIRLEGTRRVEWAPEAG